MKEFRGEFGYAPQDHYDRVEANNWLARHMAGDLREEMHRDTHAAYESTETAMGKTSIDDARTAAENAETRDMQPMAGRRARRQNEHYETSGE
ncbi:MAG: hypothetical protein K0U79_10175 [Gammaproteobacteria bacterium]|nr:hypothetical protein [Gammaproteobacteria bacterium]